MPERKTVGQLMEEMRLKDGAQNYHGHEYMDLQRFAEDTRHMITPGSWRKRKRPMPSTGAPVKKCGSY